MKVTRDKLQEIEFAFQSVGKYGGVKFAYLVARNRKSIADEIAAIAQAATPDQQFSEFDQKRLNVCEKYCLRYDNGSPMMNNNNYLINYRHKEDFDSEMSALREKFKDAIVSRETQIAELKRLLAEEVEIKDFRIKYEDVPKDITSNELFPLLDFIDGVPNET